MPTKLKYKKLIRGFLGVRRPPNFADVVQWLKGDSLQVDPDYWKDSANIGTARDPQQGIIGKPDGTDDYAEGTGTNISMENRTVEIEFVMPAVLDYGVLFSVNDADGSRHDIDLTSVNSIRIYNKQATGTSSNYYNVSYLFSANTKHKIVCAFNEKGSVPVVTIDNTPTVAFPVFTASSAEFNKISLYRKGNGVGAGRLPISYVKITNNLTGDLEHHWNVNAGKGTIIPDRVREGNEVDLQLNNITEATFWGIDNRIDSVMNLEGGSVVADINYPRQLDSSGNLLNIDVQGNPAQWIGKVPLHPQKVESNCLEFKTGLETIELSVSGLTITSYEGTSTPSILGTTLSGTIGTLYNVVFSNGNHMAFAEGGTLTPFLSSNSTLTGILNNGDTLPSSPNYNGGKQNTYNQNLDEGFTQAIGCVSAGTAYKESDVAYGVWEFDLYSGNLGSNKTTSRFISPDSVGGSLGEYRFEFIPNGTIRFVRSGAAILFTTTASYIQANTFYRILITRNSYTDEFVTGAKGTFAVYIKGGSFGTDYVLVDTTGGSGQNPILDNIYTSSAYFVSDLDAGDILGNVKINDERFDVFDFTEGTGTYAENRYPVDPTATGEELSNVAGDWDNQAETGEDNPICPELFIPDSKHDTPLMFNGDPVNTVAQPIFYDDMVPDYEEKGLWLVDVFSKAPYKFNSVLYATLSEDDAEHLKRLQFVKAVQPYQVIEGDYMLAGSTPYWVRKDY